MPDVSLAVKLTSNFSAAITEMRSTCTPFRGDVAALNDELTALNGKKIDLKVDLTRAKNELNEAKKAFRGLSDEENRLRLASAEADYSGVQQELSLVGQQAKQTERDILSASDAISKADNRASSRGAGGGGMLDTLGQAGALSVLGDTLSTAANAAVGSAFGDQAGSLFASALSTAGSGAAIGTMIGGPGIGTAVGAAVGGAVGLVNGAVQNSQKEDEGFKSYYKDLYDQVQGGSASMTEGGSAIAGQRELDRGAFSKLLGGEDTANGYLAQVQDMANRTPFLYSDLTAMSKAQAPAFGKEPDMMLRVLSGVGDAGAAAGLSTSDMGMVATAMGRMKSTGKTNLEYLNLLQERGIDAYGMVADSRGTSVNDMLSDLSKGKIPGAEAVEAILKGMEDPNGPYQGAMGLLSETFSGLSSTVEGLKQEIDAAKGEGYNAKRTESLKEEIDYMESPAGQQLKDAYRQIGEWEASVQNEGERLQREIMTAVMTGVVPQDMDEKVKARLEPLVQEYATAGDDTGRVLAQAQALAANAYYASDGYQQMAQTQKALAEGIRDDAYVVGSWKDAGYNMGLEFTKGAGAAIASTAPGSFSLTTGNAEAARRSRGMLDYVPDGSHAAGLDRVPYDGYLARLHQDEQVLTAGEARARKKGGGDGVSVTVTGNEFNVRQESDIYDIVNGIADEIEFRQLAGGT